MQPRLVGGDWTPQNLEAEQAVLGCLLIDPNAIERVVPFLRPDHFFMPVNSELYAAVLALFGSRKAVDLLTVIDYLTQRGRLEAVGGAGYIAGLGAMPATSLHVEHYGRIVERVGTMRHLMDAGQKIIALAGEPGLETQDALQRASQMIFELAETSSERDILHISEILPGVLDAIDDAQRGGEQRIKTGLVGIDRMTGGLKDGNLDVIAARPAMGKTALALNIAHSVAKQGIPACIFSCEMSKDELGVRLLGMETGIDTRRIDEGKLDEREMSQIADASGRLSEIPLHIDDTPNMKLIELGVKARRIVRQEGVRLIVVDYIQLMSSNKDDELVEITRITKGLKELARELRVPLIALSQLSREPEKRTNHRPMLSDLRASGSIEQDADVVMFLYRDVKYNPDTEQPNTAEVIFAKQRNSTEGTVKLYFNDPSQKFYDLSHTGGSEG